MKLLTRIAGAVYTALLFYIFFLARRRPHATLFQHHAGVNIHPLSSKIFAFVHYNSMTPYYQWNFISDLFGNIALFIPLPFFLAIIFKIKNGWKILLTGFIISFCVECTQFILSIGVADVDDIILNTLGTAIGLLCYKIFAKLFPHSVCL